MDKLVISTTEISSVALPTDSLTTAKVPPPIPLWSRLVVLPLVLVMPLLAIFALVIRIAMRGSAPRTQQAWNSYLIALLIASSFVFTVAAIGFVSYTPMPPQAISAGLSDLDERTSFPSLPSTANMTGVEIARDLKPLVMVATPAVRRWFRAGEIPSRYYGAAVLLHADSEGYLFATARHVAAGESSIDKSTKRVLLTSGTTGWAGADVVAWGRNSDVALLWLKRHESSGSFVQPLSDADSVVAGESIYAIGHPEGLNFSISNGIISRIAGDAIQISAPVSPGNSGGPVYDVHGKLVGVVTSKIDRSINANAENLNFAASASLFKRLDAWDFAPGGQQRLSAYIDALNLRTTSQP